MINNKTLSFHRLKREEVDMAKAMCDACVGKGLYTKEEIIKTIDSNTNFFYLIYNENGDTVGYVYYYVANIEEIANDAKLGKDIFRSVEKDLRIVGKIQSVGVMNEYRGEGIAKKAIRFALDKFCEMGIKTVFTICWKKGDTVPLKKALTECGAVFLSSAQKVWYDKNELECPFCGGRCTCDAEVYYTSL